MRPGLRKAILFTVLLGIVAFVALDSGRDVSTGRREAGKLAAPGPGEAVPAKQADRFALPQRVPLGAPRAELFGTQSWQPQAATAAAAPAAPAAAEVPPMPYRFAGKVLQGGRMQIFLAKGDAVVEIREGDTLEGGYRVQSIQEDEITLLNPLGRKETIPVDSSLPVAEMKPAPAAAAGSTAPSSTATVVSAAGAGGKAARVLWDGPKVVKLGAPFSVVLRVTSEDPVLASPMQFKFDPKLLETVAVKPGRFFDQPEHKFSFRVSPEGAIFIGAANRDQGPATDAEFLVLTFKPLKPAPVAELSIASLSLQGLAGRAIAFDSPAAFRTAIAP